MASEQDRCSIKVHDLSLQFTLFQKLPRIEICDTITKLPSKEYNKQWKSTYNQLTAQVSNQELDPYTVYVHEAVKFPYLKFEKENFKFVLNITHPSFLDFVKQREINFDSASNMLLVSVYSGLIFNIDESLIGIISSKSESDLHPPYVLPIDAANEGPIYLSFYIESATLKALILNEETWDIGKEQNIEFQLDFFLSHSHWSEMAMSNNNGIREKICKKGKTYGSDLTCGMEIEHIRNIKKDDHIFINTKLFPVPGFEDKEDRMDYKVFLGPDVGVKFDIVDMSDEAYNFIIKPRLRYSIGNELTYTPALGTLVIEETRAVSATFFPLQPLKESIQTNKTLCFCAFGKCVNNDIHWNVQETFRYSNPKPGLNGFVAYFLGTDIYKKILHRIRQESLLENSIDNVRDIVEEILKIRNCTNEEKVRLTKALLYCCTIDPVKLRYHTYFTVDHFTNDVLDKIVGRDMKDPRYEVYNEEDESFILSLVPAAQDVKERFPNSISFVKILSQIETYAAEFISLINTTLEEKSKLVNHDDDNLRQCKRLKTCSAHDSDT